MAEALSWINANQRFTPPPKLEPKIDVLISKIIGKTVYMQDPRLTRLIVKWKREKKGDDDTPDNYMSDPLKIKELKEVFNSPL